MGCKIPVTAIVKSTALWVKSSTLEFIVKGWSNQALLFENCVDFSRKNTMSQRLGGKLLNFMPRQNNSSLKRKLHFLRNILLASTAE